MRPWVPSPGEPRNSSRSSRSRRRTFTSCICGLRDRAGQVGSVVLRAHGKHRAMGMTHDAVSRAPEEHMLHSAVAMRSQTDDQGRPSALLLRSEFVMRIPVRTVVVASTPGPAISFVHERLQLFRTLLPQFILDPRQHNLSETQIGRINRRFHHVHQWSRAPNTAPPWGLHTSAHSWNARRSRWAQG